MDKKKLFDERLYQWGIVVMGSLDELDTLRDKISEITPSGVKLIWERTTPSKLFIVEK